MLDVALDSFLIQVHSIIGHVFAKHCSGGQNF